MEPTIDILVKCPKQVHQDIEEYCLNNGVSFTNYFLNLHKINFVGNPIVEDQKEFEELAIPLRKGKKNSR